MLTIYKASAGSGKTFRLVVDYLKLILADPLAYRHILAVTFTNKATAEMKERILEHLGRMANDRESRYMETIMEEMGYPEGEIRERASRALGNLLFDYDRFSVSTIDRFTQRVLKSFTRELGVNPGYQIETDSELLIAEAADRLIAGVGKNKRLQRWLESFISDKINNNRSFTIEKDLTSLGGELFRERLQERLHLLTAFSGEGENDRSYLELLYKVINGFESTVRKMASALVAVYKAEGLEMDDFPYKGGGVGNFLEKTAGGVMPEEITVRPRGASERPEAWVTRSHPRYNEILALATSRLQPGLQQLVSYFDEHSRSYNTAQVIASQWYTAAVLADLNREVATLSREKGILPLAGSNLLLRGVIDGSDTPFIYEKAGNTYHHFMLDEFQDTSVMQWDNFKPLVGNSLAGGFRSLVVGDVKQSIYRWRNSDWDILDRQVAEDFSGFPIRTGPLNTNYRSSPEVIAFNNAFFQSLPAFFTEPLIGVKAPEEYVARLLGIYRDAVQLSPEREDAGAGGYVSVEELPGKGNDFIEVSLQRLTGQVRELYARGYKPSDIAILVRKKDHGSRIVSHFLSEATRPENKDLDLRVISADSLLLKSSPGVQFIIHLFRHLGDREDALTRAILVHLWKGFTSLQPGEKDPQEAIFMGDSQGDFERLLVPLVAQVEAQMPTSGLDEMIIRVASLFRLTSLPSELPFIRTLADKASSLKLSSTGGIPGFLTWWEEKGSDTAVTVNEKTDAIRLLTIHKSKGLEFRVVLIPFLDWMTIDSQNKNILWCVPREAPFDRAPLVPVNYSDRLARTIFTDEYFREQFNMLVDNLNLVYVAFTRAAEVLWVNIPAQAEKKRIGYFVANALTLMAEGKSVVCRQEGEARIFSVGSMPRVTPSQEVPQREKPPVWEFHDFSGRLRLRTGSDDFFAISGGGASGKNLGTVVHAILAGIRQGEELEKACRRALAAGDLQSSEVTTVKARLEAMLQHPEAGEWFRGKYRVMNETTLLTPQETLRPDRIMIAGDEAIVADYKSGELRPESHRKQVVRYCETLRSAGFKRVTGYLWYIRENELVKVFGDEENHYFCQKKR